MAADSDEEYRRRSDSQLSRAAASEHDVPSNFVLGQPKTTTTNSTRMRDFGSGPTPPPRVLYQNMENCLVVWLFFSEEEQWRIQEKKPDLQHIIHTVQIFTDTSACLEYLNTVSDEIVFFIVSSKCDEEILTATHGLTQ
ncbi:unnamed protein product, partial [Adineta steineri]